MAGTEKNLGPAFPGVGATRNPSQLPPGARAMMGVPVTGVQPNVRPSSNDTPSGKR